MSKTTITISRESWQVLFGDDPIVGKPMANYYSCRLKEPVEGAKYRYEKNAGKHDGKRVDHVFMIPPGKKSILQALRLPKSDWGSSDAKSYCGSRGGRFDA